MKQFFKSRPSKELAFALEVAGGGVHKRIDENREFLELLQEKASQLLSECPWVVGWIQSHDEFFTALAETPEMTRLQPRFKTRPGFPRSWPNA